MTSLLAFILILHIGTGGCLGINRSINHHKAWSDDIHVSLFLIYVFQNRDGYHEEMNLIYYL